MPASARTGGLVTLVVLATGPIRQATRAMAVAVEQSVPGQHLTVVHESEVTRAVIEKLAGVDERQVEFLSVAGMTPGAVRNAAMARGEGEWVAVIDGSERLSPDHVDACRRTLEADRTLLFATAPGAWWPESFPASARAVQLTDLLAGGWAMSSATLFRVDAIERAGGYDPELPALVDWELMLRLLTTHSADSPDAVRSGVGLLLPLDVKRIETDDVMLLEALRADRHLPSVRAIVERYRDAFGSEPVRVLTMREAVARQLWARERGLVDKRDQLQRDLADTERDLGSLRAELGDAGQRAPEWNDLRRVTPLSRNWGLDRGRPVDRFYIERFIASHRTDIRGRVLELLDSGLTHAYGDERVAQADVLDIDPGNFRATVVADLRAPVQIPDDTYDCIILTQTLHLIDDMPAVVEQAHRMLKPGGVLLVTLPCASMVATEYGPQGDFWRVLPAAATRLFGAAFASADLDVGAHGNVLATTAFLYGLSCNDVDERELDFDDPAYPLIVTVRAVKQRRPSRPAAAHTPPLILLYHRIATTESDVHGLCVTPEAFRRQLEVLSRGRRIVPLRELARAVMQGQTIEGAVALTFDDGYRDNLEVAAPILAEFGAPATFFLTSEELDRPRRFWWDVLETAVFQASAGELVLRIAGAAWSRPLGSARRVTHDELYELLKRSGPAVRDDLVRQLAGVSVVPESHPARPVMASEIRRLASLPGVEIGAHSVHHLDLAAAGRTELFQEVFECRTSLERVGGRPVDLFAYPYGSVSQEAVGMAAAAGYLCAVTCEARPLRPYERMHRLPRLQVPSLDGTAFASWLVSAERQTGSRTHTV